MLASRILILAPHPDDEVVGCAAAIARARAEGARLFVLALTTGVPASELLWPWDRPRAKEMIRRRHEEACRAAQLLGVELILAMELPSRTLRHHLEAATAIVERTCADCRAELLWVPAYEGGHQDHDAASAIGTRLRSQLPVWEFSEYNLAGGRIRQQEFPQPRAGARTLRLAAAEMAQKQALIAIYASERPNLRHVGCRQESFRPILRYDYARPPHEGRLFYERFHWVPLPHPRIDRTRWAEVSRDLVEFWGKIG